MTYKEVLFVASILCIVLSIVLFTLYSLENDKQHKILEDKIGFISWKPIFEGYIVEPDVDYKFKLDDGGLLLNLTHLTTGIGMGNNLSFTLPLGFVAVSSSKQSIFTINNVSRSLGYAEFKEGSNVVNVYRSLDGKPWSPHADREILGTLSVKVKAGNKSKVENISEAR